MTVCSAQAQVTIPAATPSRLNQNIIHMKLNWHIVVAVLAALIIKEVVMNYAVTRTLKPDGTISQSFLGFGG